MSDPIKAGDLVIVVREGHCTCGKTSSASQGQLGWIFRVGMIRLSRGRRCIECDKLKPDTIVAVPDEHVEVNGYTLVFTLDRLRRIPPLDELEGERQKEDLREPA